jgi:hypothetical protein
MCSIIGIFAISFRITCIYRISFIYKLTYEHVKYVLKVTIILRMRKLRVQIERVRDVIVQSM